MALKIVTSYIRTVAFDYYGQKAEIRVRLKPFRISDQDKLREDITQFILGVSGLYREDGSQLDDQEGKAFAMDDVVIVKEIAQSLTKLISEPEGNSEAPPESSAGLAAP